jgi:hypothetical protein
MKRPLLLLALVLVCCTAYGHVIAYELDKMSNSEVFSEYIWQGFQHIIPLGLDHILFIACVFFGNTDLKQIVLQASMFTLAHSVTLALAMYQVIAPPAFIIEPLIAFSIVLLAIENIRARKPQPWRLALVFLFGLVHGMGFAGALSELGLPEYAFAKALIAFNIGVELGQLSVIALLYVGLAMAFAKKDWYRKVVVLPASLLIALVASYWTIQRIFF